MNWTGAELRRARTLRAAGMTFAAIAAALGRTDQSAERAFARAGLDKRRGEPRPPVADLAAAKASLAAELTAASAERATAPLLRTWPEGLWP